MKYKKEDLSPHNPIWQVLSRILKDDRLKYDPANPIINIEFQFNNKKYKARIENYDEDCSSFDVYREFVERPSKSSSNAGGGRTESGVCVMTGLVLILTLDE